MSHKLSICIPMYNESKIAADTAKALTEYFDSKFSEGEYELVFSNDGSHDNCAQIVKDLNLPNVKVVGYEDNRGKGSAVREAVLNADGDYIIYTDCDLAFGIDTIYNVYNALSSSDSDILIGSRNLNSDGYEGYTAMRKFMSKTYIKVISLIAGFNYSDSQCGIKCLKREAAHKIFSQCKINSFAFDLEMLILANKYKMKVMEYPVKIINHRESESKVNPVKDSLKMVKDVMRIKKLHK